VASPVAVATALEDPSAMEGAGGEGKSPVDSWDSWAGVAKEDEDETSGGGANAAGSVYPENTCAACGAFGRRPYVRPYWATSPAGERRAGG